MACFETIEMGKKIVDSGALGLNLFKSSYCFSLFLQRHIQQTIIYLMIIYLMIFTNFNS